MKVPLEKLITSLFKIYPMKKNKRLSNLLKKYMQVIINQYRGNVSSKWWDKQKEKNSRKFGTIVNVKWFTKTHYWTLTKQKDGYNRKKSAEKHWKQNEVT